MTATFKSAFGHRDLFLITLDALRYDVAAEAFAAGRLPQLAAVLPGGFERRQTPATFTFAAHQAFFAGFLPSPISPPSVGAAPRADYARPFAMRFAGSRTVGKDTLVLDAPCLVTACRDAGYHTICIGGTGFFNPAAPLGAVLPARFDEAHWCREMSVSSRTASARQFGLAVARLDALPPERRVFLFINASATHPPTRIFVRGAREESPATQLAALVDLDRHLGGLVVALRRRGGAVGVVCSDHGTCFGEDGQHGHRLAHESVWTVPLWRGRDRAGGDRVLLNAGQAADAAVARAGAELARLLTAGDYHSYAYSYPHKTTYRPLQPAVSLRDLWATEARDALFLYIHVPFCEQRCGFCNLFTQARPGEGVESNYIAAVERQADVMVDVLGPAQLAQLAVGGGTPTFLSAPLLDRLLRVARRFGAAAVPTSVEVSPATLDAEKLAVLVEHGTTRVSMGVQSFVPAETRAVQRHQQIGDVERALGLLREVVPVRNVDLIYGLPGQTAASLIASIDRALELGANELYLYPLYVRPLTVLDRKAGWSDTRRDLYRAGREHLLIRGLRQQSMRMFAVGGPQSERPARYRCQDDGMVGLGAGARSYTRTLHYASRFAVAQDRIRQQIAAWVAQPAEAHAVASHGFCLDIAEQRRRYVLLSLLDAGVDEVTYRARFGDAPEAHLPELLAVVDAGLATRRDGALVLTELGVECSDVLGHFLQSAAVREARAAWVEA